MGNTRIYIGHPDTTCYPMQRVRVAGSISAHEKGRQVRLSGPMLFDRPTKVERISNRMIAIPENRVTGIHAPIRYLLGTLNPATKASDIPSAVRSTYAWRQMDEARSTSPGKFRRGRERRLRPSVRKTCFGQEHANRPTDRPTGMLNLT